MKPCVLLCAVFLTMAPATFDASLPPAWGQPPATGAARRLDNLKLLPGFAAELLYTVPKSTQGSWVSLTTDNDGNLIAGDQGGAGLFKIKPARLGDSSATTAVEKLNLPISGAQGLCWAFDSLYINVNGKPAGVSRATDSDGDGQLDKLDLILPLAGGGEHGPHAVIPAADGKSLYVVGGNHTAPPKFQSSRLPAIWQEDLLLPRQWDARGHARGKLAPGGWVAIMSPDGSNVEMVSNGYRNNYDVALNRDGELFAYDADMEWDMGTPWYRPTRICHVASGSEFGWRSGTGKWPNYFEDSLPPVLNIGPGSPTGVVFGTGAKFPARYQDALYALDWTFGTIHCVHLTPDGASYQGRGEEFVSGIPLAVTDAIVGHDGAFYFTVGGRGGQSKLYRIFYEGEASTAPATSQSDPESAAARSLRHRLEAFHGHRDPSAVAAAWPHLASDDRFVRYAARLAIENQPVAEWQQRALDERNPQAAIMALMALARHGDKTLQPRLVEALGRLDPASLSEQQQLSMLRTYALAFMRMSAPTDAQRVSLAKRLDTLYPADSDNLNVELARLMIYLDAPTVIAKTLKLIAEAKPTPIPAWGELIQRNQRYGGPIRRMLDNMPPLQEIQYVFMLRNVRYGWTLQQRREYFKWFITAGKHPGGASYGGFLNNIRSEALKQCSAAERAALADITGQKIEQPPAFKFTPPKGPAHDWQFEEVVDLAGSGLKDRDFARGQNLFHAATCVKCHRFDGGGGNIGPDLTSVASRLSTRDLIENIIDPSKVISDQYGSHQVTTADGKQLLGRVIDVNPEDPNGVINVYTQDIDAPPAVVKKTDIEEMVPSKISQMPNGLLKPLNQDEMLDLLAYLLSRGNPQDRMFAP